MMMNFQMQKALAQLVHAIRSDWDVNGIIAALGTAREHGRADDIRAITDAAVAAALDVKNRTPAVIPMNGEHWNARRHTPPRARLDMKRTCGICSRDELTCRAVVPQDHEFVPYRDVVQAARPAPGRNR